jgi:hypothetical protein
MLNEPQIDFESFWNRFLSAEKRSRAFNLKISGIQIYPFLRTRLFYAIAQEVGLFDNPHPNFSKEDGIASPLKSLDALLPAGSAKSIVVPFRRKVSGIDSYSERVIEVLRAEGEEPLVLPYFEGFDAPTPDGSNLDLDHLREYFTRKYEEAANRRLETTGKYARWRNREVSKRRYAEIIAAFETEFQIKLSSFEKYPSWVLRRAIVDEYGFRDFFRHAGTRNLYLVNAYSDPGLVRAAKLAGIKVSEIQHGFVSAYHPAYDYPRGVSSQSAPNELLTWGTYWNTAANFAKGMKARTTGPTRPFSEYRAKALAETRIVKNQVLFTSQGAIGPALFASALEVARAQKDLGVIFRLHPNESLEDYEQLARELSLGKGLPANFSISHKTPIFLDLVSQSEYLVGAFSTTLFEGLALGCKVLVLPLPGFENTRPAIAAGDITLVTELAELPRFLAAAKPAADATRYYSETR